MNQITGFQDGSNIYGSNLGSQRELREFRGGRLRIQNIKGREYLPDNEEECANEIGETCFKSGMGNFPPRKILPVWKLFCN